MAGSWNHMTTESGKLRNNETFCDLIETGGDAYEAAEECFSMIWWLAAQAAPYNDLTPAELIAAAQEHYKDGLRLGGVQRPR